MYIIYLVKLKDHIIKFVEEFGYLGSVLQENGEIDVDIKDVDVRYSEYDEMCD